MVSHTEFQSLAARGFALSIDALSSEMKAALAEEGLEIETLSAIAGSDRVVSGEAELTALYRAITENHRPGRNGGGLERAQRAYDALKVAAAKEVPTPYGNLPDDDALLRRHVQRVVRGQGVEEAIRQINGMESSLEDFRMLGGSEVQAVRLKRMLGVMRREAERLRVERDRFLERFRPAAQATARRFLAASRETVHRATSTYGVQMGWDLQSRLVFDAAHPEKVRSLVEAATEIRSSAERLQRLEALEAQAMASPGATAGGMTLAQLTQSIDRERRSLAAVWRDRTKEHPILTALHPRDLEMLTKGRDAAIHVLHRYGASVLEAIDDMEAHLAEDPDAVFRLKPVIDAAKEDLGLDPTSLEASFAGHRVEAVARDDRLTQGLITLVAVTAGVAAALPSGGTSLAVAAAIASSIDLYAFADSAQRFAFASAASHTDPNPDRALSKDAPSVLWLAIEALGVATGTLGVATAIGKSRFARALSREDALGEVARKLEAQVGRSEAERLFQHLGEERFLALGNEVPGDLLGALIESHGADVVAYALDELSVFEAKRLFSRFDRKTIEAVATEMGPRALRAAAFELGDDTIKTLAPVLGGSGIARLHLAGPNARKFIDAILADRRDLAKAAMEELKKQGDPELLKLVRQAADVLRKARGPKPPKVKPLKVDAAYEPLVTSFASRSPDLARNAAEVFGSKRLSDAVKQEAALLLSKADQTGRFEERGLKRWMKQLAGAEDELQAKQVMAELERGLEVANGKLHPEGQIILGARKGTHEVGPGRSVEIGDGDMNEIDVLYLGADGKIHAEEVKHRAQALREKLFGSKGDELNLDYLRRMRHWKDQGDDRIVGIVIPNERGWFDVFAKGPDEQTVAYHLRRLGIELRVSDYSLDHGAWEELENAWMSWGSPKDLSLGEALSRGGER